MWSTEVQSPFSVAEQTSCESGAPARSSHIVSCEWLRYTRYLLPWTTGVWNRCRQFAAVPVRLRHSRPPVLLAYLPKIGLLLCGRIPAAVQVHTMGRRHAARLEPGLQASLPVRRR